MWSDFYIRFPLFQGKGVLWKATKKEYFHCVLLQQHIKKRVSVLGLQFMLGLEDIMFGSGVCWKTRLVLLLSCKASPPNRKQI